ncbi:MAG: Rpn family recombination-promoting nuclease/putative transposase [Methylococcaceae bacterium]
MKFVDPKTDIAFKKIFGNDAHKSILIEFLNEILELDSPIESVTINNAYQVPRLKGLKETTLDVKATDKLKREFIVEMQVEKEVAFAKRAVYYSSKAYSQQLKKAQKYHLLKPVIFLGILDFVMFDHDSVISRHLILNKETGQHDLKDLEFNFIELKKFTKSQAQLETVAEKWIYFLQHADDLDRVPENADTPALKDAYEVAAQHTWTREELDIYEAQEFKIAVNQNVIETARLDGIAEGIEQGLEKGKLEEKFAIAKGMLAEGLSIEIIAKLTSLTHDEIQSLI